MDKRVIVAHPGKQHSYQTSKAINSTGMLYSFITTVYNKNKSLTSFLFKISSGNLKKKIGSHIITDLSDDNILIICEFRGIIALFLNKFPLLNKYYVLWNNKLNDGFGKKVAKYAIKNSIDIIISYDYNSTKLFETVKKIDPSIVLILDVSIATRPFMQQTFLKDIELTGEYALKSDFYEIWNKNSIDRVQREIAAADYYFAPSEIVKKSLIFCGAREERIKIIPYGVDCEKFQFLEKTSTKNKIKLIYVGQVNYRKGIHHLLKVISSFKATEVELHLVGSYDTNSSLYQKYKNASNIHFMGFITRDKLTDAYQNADVFVFPTLGEGFGMVVLEALSCGLPVIISDVAGGNDAISDGIDGFVVPVSNDDKLREKIQWFLDNPNKIPEMSKNARMKAEKYTWNSYHIGVNSAITEILIEKRE